MILKWFVCMAQDSSNVDLNIGIIGGGASGCACAYFINRQNPAARISIIDYGSFLRTILPTGGGRCNLAHYEFDFKELAKNYPRGEKFLYSVFSRFSTADTLEMFENLGIKTYTQDDMRIFPESNSAKEVQTKLLDHLKGINFIKEKALRLEPQESGFKVVTDMNSYRFDKLVYATGGHNSSGGYEMIERLGITIIEPKPALVALETRQNFSQQMGVVLKDVHNRETGLTGDILFTHFGLSGPLIYKISSLKAYDKHPYELSFNLYPNELNLQETFNTNPHKQIKNILSELFPQKVADLLLKTANIDSETKCHRIDGKTRDKLYETITDFRITVKGVKKDGETVTAGGVDLNQINPKTLESKQVPNLYFCGEVINIDGFCGGFNLQNCWSTAYIAAQNFK